MHRGGGVLWGGGGVVGLAYKNRPSHNSFSDSKTVSVYRILVD